MAVVTRQHVIQIYGHLARVGREAAYICLAAMGTDPVEWDIATI